MTIGRSRRTGALAALVAVALLAVGCQQGSAARTLQLVTLNDSGVTGSVSFREVQGRTEVEVHVEPAGNLDMPAHIHPGSCDDLVPQPKYPLENVRDGVSRTTVPARVDELFAGGLALNVHRSNDDLGTYTACVDIR
ncbi:MAG TPA: hypothetical protein VMQ65_01075 [Candidatus Limnocylindria bacterium]|nr:hypothetical protein [Candidatus Limnocylindria bacterium]